MSLLKDLNSTSKQEFCDFFDSFDSVFSDVDGVLVHVHNLIKGADRCIENLKKLGKAVVYITNNSAESSEQTQSKLKAFNVQDKDFFNPVKAIVNFLININYDKSKKLYVIGTTAFKNALADGGFDLIDFEPSRIPENVLALRDICLDAKEQAPKIGGVIIDFDINFSLVKGCRATVFLTTNPEMLFLSGLNDYVLPFGDNLQIPGAGFYVHAIENVSKRQSVVLAKPGEQFGKMVNQFYGVTDPQRVLFIGDSIQSDMTFATKCGYKKLLVLTGTTSYENIESWPAAEELKPQYYVESLDVLDALLKKHNLVNDMHKH